jgi:hypothetical protein
MANILEIGEGMLYVDSKGWQCDLGGCSPVLLGVVFEAVDLLDTGHINGNGTYSVVVDSHLIPQPECLDPELVKEASEEATLSRESLIREIYLAYGGVPVNIDAVQPAKASCGFSSFLADSKIESIEGTDVRHFKDIDEAMSFARSFYAVYAGGLFTFIDAILDNSIRGGGCGWDKIRMLSGR